MQQRLNFHWTLSDQDLDAPEWDVKLYRKHVTARTPLDELMWLPYIFWLADELCVHCG